MVGNKELVRNRKMAEMERQLEIKKMIQNTGKIYKDGRVETKK